MNPINIAEGITATILAAALIAFIAWLVSWIRNAALERELKRALSPSGVGVGFDPITHKGSFTLQIHNYANAAIRVRSIVFIADKFHVELEPNPGGKIFQTPLSNEITRKKFKRTYLSRGGLEQDNNPHSILLPSKTMSIWRVHPETIGTREWKIMDIFMVFEYATIFGNTALVRMKASESTFNLVKENFERLSTSVHHKLPYDFYAHLRNEA